MNRFLFILCVFAIASVGCKPQKNETTWIDPNKISPGPVLHEKLSDAQVARITHIQRVFQDVDSMPLSKWIEDFSRDANPDREIEIWESMAEPFDVFVKRHKPDQQRKKEAYQIVLLRSGASAEETVKHHKRIALSEEEIQEILSLYTADPKPIRVYQEK